MLHNNYYMSYYSYWYMWYQCNGNTSIIHFQTVSRKDDYFNPTILVYWSLTLSYDEVVVVNILIIYNPLTKLVEQNVTVRVHDIFTPCNSFICLLFLLLNDNMISNVISTIHFQTLSHKDDYLKHTILVYWSLTMRSL